MANSVSVYSDTIKAKIRRLKWVWSVDGTSLEDETGATGFKCSMVDGTAFFVADGIDLSGYVGKFIQLKDSTGKQAYGYISAAGGGETLGSEIATNGGMESGGTGGDFNGGAEIDDGVSDTFTGWTNDNVNDGLGNKIEATATCHGGSVAVKETRTTTLARPYQDLATTPSALYKLDAWVRGDGSVGPYYWLYDLVNCQYMGATYIDMGNSTITYAEYTKYWTAPVGCTSWRFTFICHPIAGIVYGDDFSLTQVTDCAVTGVRIVSTPNGATRNWASITSGFNPNDAAMTFDIYDTAVSGGSVSSPVTGQIIGIKAEPDTTSVPPEDYDITIVDTANGMDVLNSDAVDLPQSATSVENIRVPLDNLNSRPIYLVDETLSFSGDILALGSPASGTFYLYIREP